MFSFLSWSGASTHVSSCNFWPSLPLSNGALESLHIYISSRGLTLSVRMLRVWIRHFVYSIYKLPPNIKTPYVSLEDIKGILSSMALCWLITPELWPQRVQRKKCIKGYSRQTGEVSISFTPGGFGSRYKRSPSQNAMPCYIPEGVILEKDGGLGVTINAGLINLHHHS